MADQAENAVGLERRLARLAEERTTLFARAGTTSGLSKDEHARLGVVERELDECFNAVRRQRAERDARRFTMEGPLRGRGIARPAPQPPTR
jgi:hypothetical protein